MPHYKLTYFDVKGFGEPIRFMLHYMNKDFEDNRLDRDQWPKLKSTMPFGKVPILEVDGKLYHESTAILRYLANEAGLAGKTPSENLQIDMIVGAFGDLASEISRFFRCETPSEKEKLKQALINETIPFYLTRIETVLKNNNGYLANGRLSWADFYIVGYTSSLPGILGVDLAEMYPFFKEYRDRIYSLPGIKEWVQRRPESAF